MLEKEINLNTEISKITKLSKEHDLGLKKLGLINLKDLLNYFPTRYADERENKNIENLNHGEKVSLFGEIRDLKIKRSFKGHIPMCEGKLIDATGSIKLIWFHQAYIAKMYQEGEFVRVSGLVQIKEGKRSILNGDIERVSRDHIFYENNIFESIDKNKSSIEMIPIYKETKGISSNYIRSLIKRVIYEYKILEKIQDFDPIPKNILESLHLPTLDKAYLYIHLPKSLNIKKAEEQILVARKRFSFEEIFYLQILKRIEREKAKNSLGYEIQIQPLQSYGQLPQGKRHLRIMPYNKNLLMQANQNRKKLTEAEKIFWNIINKDKIGFDFTRQKVVGNFILDFYSNDLLLGIEIDGEIHNKEKEYDKERESFLNSQNIKIIRFKNEEVKYITTDYLKDIFQKRLIEVNASLGEAGEQSETEGVLFSKSSFLYDFIYKIENKFNFSLTKAQINAIKNISNDLEKSEPMGRLLEGDVGSGKTLVAAAISYLVTHFENRDKESGKRLQVAIMAPTEILATQHFESFITFFKDENIEIGLLTSKTCKKFPSKVNIGGSTNISKPQLKRFVEEGNISIIIGTHSLIQKTLSFQNLALAIIDEQHRFGVRQRAALANKKSSSIKVLAANDLKNLTNKRQKIVKEKDKLPHLLSMTATPIPRTLALTIFGDLDLTILDELPKNRKPIITKIEKEKDREKVYTEILEEIKKGYQAYIVVPRIDELDEEQLQNAKKLNLRSVASEVKNLEEFFNKTLTPSVSLRSTASHREATFQQERIEGIPSFGEGVVLATKGVNEESKFGKINIFGMHSKIKKEEKEKIMQEFLENKIQILVSTSVIEVGVNIPNATRMIIEGAERFGLAQLHQLRGRIGRGERESICYLFTNSTSDITVERLSSLLKAKNGFELAELDLNQRGIGSLMSGKQWGVSDLAMEAIKNLKLVEIAREEAKKLIEKDFELKDHKLLKDIIEDKEKAHME